MTITGSIAFFVIMAVLAAIPSSSALLIVVQSAAKGVRNGVATAIGVVAGDLILMSMAIFGMTALATQLGALFVVIKYLAAAYLIWFGIGLLRSYHQGTKQSRFEVVAEKRQGGIIASFGSGLLLTMGDLKAIFFYSSLLPTFLDLKGLTGSDVLLVTGIMVVAVGGAKIAYAFGAEKASHAIRAGANERYLKVGSGSLLVGAGAYILLRD